MLGTKKFATTNIEKCLKQIILTFLQNCSESISYKTFFFSNYIRGKGIFVEKEGGCLILSKQN